MKITIKTQGTFSVGIPIEKQIVDRIHYLVRSKNFASWKDQELVLEHCCNVEEHSRLCILLAIFVDSLNKKHNCYTRFGKNLSFYLPSPAARQSVLNLLNSITDLSSMEIIIE